MKTSVHFRFELYVLCASVALAALVYFSGHNTNEARFLAPVFILFLHARKILGPSYEGWHESDREVSNRALVIGFIICLVAVWGGGLALAYYIPVPYRAPKYFIWAMVALVWVLFVFPVYQWWRTQKPKATAC